MDMQNWRGLKTDYIEEKLKNVSPTFFKFLSICMKVSFFNVQKSSLFAIKRLLLCRKKGLKFLKYCDLAPLSIFLRCSLLIGNVLIRHLDIIR